MRQAASTLGIQGALVDMDMDMDTATFGLQATGTSAESAFYPFAYELTGPGADCL